MNYPKIDPNKKIDLYWQGYGNGFISGAFISFIITFAGAHMGWFQ